MAWELLAIWAIVILTVTWFFRDEKRLRADAALARAAAYYAHAPQYRFVAVQDAEPVLPARRTGGLNSEQRAFLEAFSAPKPQG